VRREKIEELRNKRIDSKMKGVVLNTEERDKKFAHKYWVKELPHPYSSVE
jgi:U3 small nucleolar RNA-associated protein 14